MARKFQNVSNNFHSDSIRFISRGSADTDFHFILFVKKTPVNGVNSIVRYILATMSIVFSKINCREMYVPVE